jgi:predicted CopG family antitoxin
LRNTVEIRIVSTAESRMALRVYRLAVVGCPRGVVEPTTAASADGPFSGVGKSCLCNRFVKPEAYTETHDSLVSAKKWSDDAAITGDHFLYWGATTRHLQDGSKARFQVVEQTEFYDKESSAAGEELRPHPSDASYLERATSVRIATSSIGKVAVRLKAEQASARAGGIRSTTQIFPNEDFGGKNGGVLGFACVFDPTLSGEQMKRQMLYITELLQALNKRKKKLAVACSKCDEASEEQIKLGASLAASVLKKPIPFFEVSSRDDVNVEDVFFTLIGHARKSPKLPRAPKSPKSTRHFSISSHSCVSYKDAVSLKKKDIRRAKDAYRRLLQKKITSFSAVWSEAYLMLEKEEEFSVLLQLAGEEGKEMVKNMFCLRLIEIKLAEGAKLFGMSSATKKLNKDKSRDYQHYLSDALKSHPDLR